MRPSIQLGTRGRSKNRWFPWCCAAEDHDDVEDDENGNGTTDAADDADENGDGGGRFEADDNGSAEC